MLQCYLGTSFFSGNRLSINSKCCVLDWVQALEREEKYQVELNMQYPVTSSTVLMLYRGNPMHRRP